MITRRQAILASLISLGGASRSQTPRMPTTDMGGLLLRWEPATLRIVLGNGTGEIARIEVCYQGQTQTISAKEIWEALKGGCDD